MPIANLLLVGAAANPQEVMTSPRPDRTPPQVSIQASPSVLWPTAEEFVEVAAVVTAVDRIDPAPKVALVSITASDRLEAGDDVQDAHFGTNDRRFRLRATRGRAIGERVYKITYQVTDASGNVGTATARVRVATSPPPRLSALPSPTPSPP